MSKSNKFSHLSNKDNKPKTVNEFIAGAEKNPPNSKEAKNINDRALLKLSVIGKMSRINCENGKLVFLKKNLKEELEKYCIGNEQGMINYLLKRGLDSLKEEEKLLVIDASQL